MAASGDGVFGVFSGGTSALARRGVSSIGTRIDKAGSVPFTGTSAVLPSKRPHGNSRTSAEPQLLYNLLERNGVGIAKIGITTPRIGQNRYSRSFLEREKVIFVPVKRHSNRLIARAVETASIVAFTLRTGSRPRLNKVDY